MAELTKPERARLKRALLALQQELESVLAGMEAGTQPVEPDSAIGRISRMDAMQIQQMAQANQRTARRRLNQVNAALLRWQEERYGECAKCFDDIGFRRLQAQPEAPFCVACQTQRESAS
jgi:DnaK suppressor protein